MVYGYYITDTSGNKRFITEGCTYCSMSTGGQHESHCPLNPYFKEGPCHISSGKLVWFQDISKRIQEIRDQSYIKYGEAWKYT